MRHDLVQHLRDQIASGTYVTSGKIKLTADRVMEDLHGETEEAKATLPQVREAGGDRV